MFVYLGLRNSLRQLGRSLLVMLGMILAAMSLTSALSFSEQEMSSSYQFYRDYLGGEILVSPVKWVGQGVRDLDTSGHLVHRRLPGTGLNRLELFYPELFQEGYLTDADAEPRQAFTEAEIAELLRHPGVEGLTVQPQMGAEMTNLSLTYEHYSSFTILPLPADGLLDVIDLEIGVKALDLANYPDRELPLVWINYWLTFPEELLEAATAQVKDSELHYNRDSAVPPDADQLKRMSRSVASGRLTREMQLPQPGERAELVLPKMRREPDGSYSPDFSDTIRVPVVVADYVGMPTRAISWETSFGTLTEQGCLHASNIYLTGDSWQQLWEMVSDGASQPLHNVALKVSDMGQLKQIVASLRESFPQYSFIDVSSFAKRMEQTSRLDFFYRAPPHTYSPVRDANLAVPAELGPVIGILFLLIAGMLIASRMLTGAAARREEIGILKTLGARRRDVAVMAMTEAMLISLLGSSIGFLLVRLGGIAIERSNGLPWSDILLRTVTEGATVVGMATVISLLFALLPAVRLSNLTVMGVLRGE